MTKAQIKFIQSLSRQKYRKEHNAYLVEGDKNAKEWLRSGVPIRYIIASRSWHDSNLDMIAGHREAEVIIAEDFELEKISSLQHAQQVVLVVHHTEETALNIQAGQWYLYLDRIQDPGNMGTIIRTADWFGIAGILYSPDCVELHNPKVVQATMGSLLRVPAKEMTAAQLLDRRQAPLYAAALEGTSLNRYRAKAHRGGIIAMGNESQGLSPLLLAAADHKIRIPGRGGAESLNVAVATGIICAALTNALP